MAGLRGVCRGVEREDGAEGHACPCKNGTPVRGVTFREDIIQDRGEREGVLAPRQICRKARVVTEVARVDGLQEARELP